MIKRYPTKPSVGYRIKRNPVVLAALVFLAFFAFIGLAEFLSTMMGAAFDVRAG